MNRPPRRRMPEEPLLNQTDSSGPGERRKLNLFAQIGLIVLIIGFGVLSVWWILSDISGEYYGYNSKLGNVNLTLLRKAAGITGDMAYGSGAALSITDGKITGGNQLTLNLELADKWVKAGQNARSATFKGEIADKVIKGTLQESERTYPLTLTRNALTSLYRQIQAHLPWLS